jgi:hypothetical protein
VIQEFLIDSRNADFTGVIPPWKRDGFRLADRSLTGLSTEGVQYPHVSFHSLSLLLTI